MQGSEINADRRRQDYDNEERKGHEDGVHEDSDGRYIDEYQTKYKHSHKDIKREVDRLESDYSDSLRVHGLTEEEWKLKQKKEQQNLEELGAKEKELEEAAIEVSKAQNSLGDEKKKIDGEIKSKLDQNEKLKLEFEKRAAERAEAERKAAEERER